MFEKLCNACIILLVEKNGENQIYCNRLLPYNFKMHYLKDGGKGVMVLKSSSICCVLICVFKAKLHKLNISPPPPPITE